MPRIFLMIILSLGLRATAQESLSAPQPQDLNQSQDNRRFEIKISPVPLLLGGFNADFSTRIAKSSWSVGLFGERTQQDLFFTKNNGHGVGLNSAYFFRGSPFLNSWFISPALTYRWGHEEDNAVVVDATADYQMYSLSTMLGYQWHLQTFSLSLGVGGEVDDTMYKNIQASSLLAASFGGDPNTKYQITSPDDSVWRVKLRFVAALNLGWAF